MTVSAIRCNRGERADHPDFRFWPICVVSALGTVALSHLEAARPEFDPFQPLGSRS